MSFGNEILSFIKRLLHIGQGGEQSPDNPGEVPGPGSGKVGEGDTGQPGEVAGGGPGEDPGPVQKQGDGQPGKVAGAPAPTNFE
jgi:hypothetical protein